MTTLNDGQNENEKFSLIGKKCEKSMITTTTNS